MSVVINGDKELDAFFKRLNSGMMPRVVVPAANDYAQAVVNEMHKRQHRRSGNMYRSTRVQKLANGAAAVVGVSYAEEENQRPGRKMSKYGTGRGTPHRYVEPSIKVAEPTLINSIVMRLNTLISS